MNKSRNKHSAAFKAKVALAAVREQETVAELSRKYKVHSNQVYRWKSLLLDNVHTVFEKEPAAADNSEREAELLKKIGELTVERDFLSSGLGRIR